MLRTFLVFALVGLGGMITACMSKEAASKDRWVTAWAASPTETATPDMDFVGHTISQNVLITASGSSARIRVSNVDKAASFTLTSMRLNGAPIMFGGSATAVIPPDGFLCSDPVETPVRAGEKANIRLFIPPQSTLPTIHWYGRETARVSPPGNYSDAEPFPTERETDFRVLISAVDVLAASDTIGIIAMGDSITDGSSSPVGTDTRWPDVAWRALTAQGYSVAMANAGIGGDRLLRDARHTGTSPGILRRLHTDALGLSQPQILVLAAGINDISWPGATMRGRELAPADQLPSLQEMITGFEAAIVQARAAGLTVIGATITPYAGQSDTFTDFYTPQKDQLRRDINDWIRTSNAFDAVIDFDALLRDPSDPSRLKSAYDSGDHIHPSRAGYEAMGRQAAAVIAQLLMAPTKSIMATTSNCAPG